MYRHALPPGFVLKSQKKKTEDDALRNQISLEEFLEVCVSAPLSCFRFPPLSRLFCLSRLPQIEETDEKSLTYASLSSPKTASDTSWTSPS